MNPRRPADKRGSRAPVRSAGVGTPDERASGRASRVVIENVQPQIDAGRFPIKRTVGEAVFVTADVFTDGHDKLSGVLKHRQVDGKWHEVPLAALGNDSWGASFVVTELGECEYTVEAWIDHFGSWLAALIAKAEAGDDVESELLQGAAIVERAMTVGSAREEADDGEVRIRSEVRLKPPFDGAQGGPEALKGPDTTSVGLVVSGFPPTPQASARLAEARFARAGGSRTDDDTRLLELAKILHSSLPQSSRVAAARDPEIARLVRARPDRSASTTADHPLRVVVDPMRARFGAWYEMFPRSCTSDPNRGGTLRDAEGRLSDVAAMGFDVLYLPPVHPIGTTNRKGRNNVLTAAPGDPGSPWAIGSDAGGHTAIEPGLGTLDDFDRFVATAQHLGLQVALDVAFQASPDHPWTKTHPQWFQRRPDGSIKYAENPPKKYQDIYPFDFESEDWRALWDALRDIFLFWMSHGVTIFRVDNPHTKPFAFWEWVIAEVRSRRPDAIFLSEAFTRPKVMRRLAKLGFNQSYTYFTWRNTAQELREYLTELTRTEAREYMRPNFFANTPDILHAFLQHGGRPAFEVRLILAATLSASYGIYSGFELCENVPIRAGSEEYVNSEKYEIRPRNFNQPGNLNELIARVNEIRRSHRALQFNSTLAFHGTENPALLWFSKTAPADLTRAAASSDPWGSESLDARVFVVANTDPGHVQHGRVQVPIWELGLGHDQPYVVYDLLDEARYVWHGEWNYVKLDPAERMAHIFVIRTE